MSARPVSPAKLGLKLLILIGLVFGAIEVSAYVRDLLDMELMPHNEEMMHKIILISLGTYTALMATPFLPGAEIGMGLLTAFGGAIAPAVYVATVLGLCLSFAVGRLVPIAAIARFFRTVHLNRAATAAEELAALPRAEILPYLTRNYSAGTVGWILKFRYIALILLINLPGNIVIGGGGGIALAAGTSRLFHPVGFVLSVLIAVIPVPLAFFTMSG